MRRILSLSLVVLVLIGILCSCDDSTYVNNADSTRQTVEKKQMAIEVIDPCVVEPDDKCVMSESDTQHYRALMNGLLTQQKTVVLSDDNDKNKYYIDLLKQSPYYFFAESCVLDNNTAVFEYAYSREQQNDMQAFMDEKLLEIVNHKIEPDDNELDIILKVHSAVANLFDYDHDRTDNKQIGSPLFKYPADEIYKSLKTGKSLCYGFAYVFRFALLQHDIDCFCVYGPCAHRDEAHMWNIFKYDGQFYTCDPAWDRSEDNYARLVHFGKTDDERFADGLEEYEYSSKLQTEYGEVTCTDEKFKIFRGITRYSYVNGHTYFMVDFEGNQKLFDTDTFEMR